MAKRPLKGNQIKTPVVDLRLKVESALVGVLKGSFKTKYGHGYHLILESTNGSTTLQDGDKRKEVDVKAGDVITLFASGGLEESLQLAEEGQRIEVIFHGKKVNPKSGREFNDFEANVLE